ncbi:MAG: polyprenol monophosphomannose synthase [Elusimicrobiota bacterium]
MIVVMIPTYNEKDTILTLCDELLALDLDLNILVVDDNSPDGTANIVKELSKRDKRVRCLLRTENRGRGYAGAAGFKKALEYNPEYIVEMDADFSHNPKYVYDFVKAVKSLSADVVIGSRYVSSGKDEERSLIRKIISACAGFYLRIVLGIKANDPTSGFRLFTNRAVKEILPKLRAKDPFIVTEILYYCYKYKMKVIEVPIQFEERRAGQSKLNASILWRYLFNVWKLRLGIQ